MVKLTFCLTRLSHLSRRELPRYRRDRHGPPACDAADKATDDAWRRFALRATP